MKMINLIRRKKDDNIEMINIEERYLVAIKIGLQVESIKKEKRKKLLHFIN
jgi:hypothetical protein